VVFTSTEVRLVDIFEPRLLKDGLVGLPEREDFFIQRDFNRIVAQAVGCCDARHRDFPRLVRGDEISGLRDHVHADQVSGGGQPDKAVEPLKRNVYGQPRSLRRGLCRPFHLDEEKAL
jgi:hypothetical protein